MNNNVRGSVEVKSQPKLNFEIMQEAMATGEPYPQKAPDNLDAPLQADVKKNPLATYEQDSQHNTSGRHPL